MQIQVYAYNDAEMATMDARQISRDGSHVEQRLPNGNTAMTSMNWIAPPHVFHRDRVLVLYLGSNQGDARTPIRGAGAAICGSFRTNAVDEQR